ncbi:hypothetical protein JZ751_029722 [Albula glossodonta]|uniref:Ig-like domain-containing protein n=1 Tax=Albula glossodonta TaxID=121402 RepID=A0A8T2NE53_9TELE|nr:hypothetical protein JZ751_029722 [Albula glossodonta]
MFETQSTERSVCIHLSLAWKVQIPNTVSAVEGSCVIVPCQTGTHQRAIWFQYHSINWPKVYDSQNPASVIPHFRGRTSLLGSAAEGNCSLKIEAVRPEDNGVKLYPWIDPDKSSSQKYQKIQSCAPHIRAGCGHRRIQPHISMQHASLLPHTPPAPHMVQLVGGARLQHFRGVGCAARRVVVDGKAEPAGIMATSPKQRQLCYTARQRRHQNKLAPVDVRITADRTVVIEGAAVSLSCGSRGNPPPVSYRWLEAQDSEPILANSTLGEGAEITAYARRGSSYSCVAQNPYGELRSPWLPLDVHFPPAILPGSNCSETDGALACVCRVEAHPNATLRWDVNGNDVPASLTSVVQHSSRETVANLTGPIHQLLNVSCTASNTIGNITYYLPIAITPGLSKQESLCFSHAMQQLRTVPYSEASTEPEEAYALYPEFPGHCSHHGRLILFRVRGEPPAASPKDPA